MSTTFVNELDNRSALDFVLTLRKRWADTLYPALRREFEQEVARRDAVPTDGHAAAELMRHLPLYPWFSWLERGQQKMMWRTVQSSVIRRWDELGPTLEDLPADPIGCLELDPALAAPAYYTAVDIHCQPGGVWGDDTNAFVYEQGAQIVMLRDNDEYKFHTLFTRTAVPLGDHRRVVDIGCGFGKSTRPFRDAFPDAEVIGIDLSAPALKLGHVAAERMGKPIWFRQADGADTGLETSSSDLVTGTMVLHEMPTTHVAAVLTEATRLLRPGGMVRFLEFSRTGEPFRDATVYGHGERNNEPWLPALMDADIQGMCERAGLTDGRWVPFDERERGVSADGWGPRDEWHFPWAVLAAEKPA